MEYLLKLIVIHQCNLNVISTSAISDSIFDVSDPTALTVYTLAWTYSLSPLCPAIAYSLIDLDTGVAADSSVFSISASN
jgi:hypothetical protein